MRTVRVRGESNFEIGFQVGEQMSSLIAESFSQNRTLDRIVSLASTGTGREQLDTLIANNELKYPEIMQEIYGIAQGCGQPLEKVLCANFQELITLVKVNDPDEIKARMLESDPGSNGIVGCTDVHMIDTSSGISAWGHNEDGAGGYIIDCTIENTDRTINSEFLAYAYAGCIPGWAWGFNRSGIVFSINALTPKVMNMTGLGTFLVSRDVLDATSIEDALERITNCGTHASGQHFNLGHIHSPELHISVETSPIDCYTRYIRHGEFFLHANSYLEGDKAILEGRSGPFLDSSIHRLSRAQEIIQSNDSQFSIELITKIIGDCHDVEFPIYRNGRFPDYAATDHSILVDLFDQKLHLYDKTNPNLHSPTITYDMQRHFLR